MEKESDFEIETVKKTMLKIPEEKEFKTLSEELFVCDKSFKYDKEKKIVATERKIKEFIKICEQEGLEKSDGNAQSPDRYVIGIRAGVIMMINVIKKRAGEKLR